MNVRILSISLLLALAGLARAETPPPKAEFPLWPEGAVPGALGKDAKDVPTLTPYWAAPDKATGAAVIIFPGGGYTHLAPHEGEPFARWLSDRGITCFVLKYRLYTGGYHLQQIILDAARSVRYVRANAVAWKLDPKRIGIVGASAGGHLAAVLSTTFDDGNSAAADAVEKVSSRPDVTILCYGFILFDQKTMSDPARREAALGKDVSDADALRFAPALNVRAEAPGKPGTPPCFIWQTVEDASVTVDNALTFANALRVAKVRFALHLFEHGKHGLGLGVKAYAPDAPLHPWTKDCELWLREQKFMK